MKSNEGKLLVELKKGTVSLVSSPSYDGMCIGKKLVDGTYNIAVAMIISIL